MALRPTVKLQPAASRRRHSPTMGSGSVDSSTVTRLAHPAVVQYRVLAHEPRLNVLYIYPGHGRPILSRHAMANIRIDL